MATPVDSAASITGNALIDGLLQGSAWQPAAGTRNITYSFSLNDNPNGGSWPDAMKEAVREAFATWSSVASIAFSEASSGTVYTASSADIAIVLAGNELETAFGAGILSIGIFPSPGYASDLLGAGGLTRADYPNPEGDVVLDNYHAAFNYLNEGGVGLTVMIHEIGHALGLKHPGDDGGNGRPTFAELGISDLDSNLYTVMSYNDPGGNPIGEFPGSGNAATPMPLDVLAIQQLYGANMSYHTGDDVYGFSFLGVRTLWDAGGNDTISAAGSYGDASIDLRPGHFSRLYAAQAVAYNVTIENAVGGYGNDTLIGNDTDNRLDGGAGSDAMSGGAGDDTYVVDSAGDVLTENAGEGADSVEASVSYTLPANVENITLTGDGLSGQGNDVDNTLRGTGIGDVLIGGAGNDTLIDGSGGYATLQGGTDDDIYVVSSTVMPCPALSLFGQPGDYVSQGQSFVFTADTGNFSVALSDYARDGEIGWGRDGLIDYITISYSGTTSSHWFNVIIASNALGQNLAVGTYLNAERAAFATAGHPGIDIGGDGRGANQTFGSFVIDDISIDYSGASPRLVRLSASFEQHAESPTAPALTGTILYGEPDTTVSTEIVENPNEGTDTVQSSVTYALSENVENLFLTGSADIDGTGNRGSNVLVGNDGDNTLFYTGGLDTFHGGAGIDTTDFSACGSAVWVGLSYAGIEGWAMDHWHVPVWHRMTGRTHHAGNTRRAIAELDGIENLTGSAFNDRLIGDAGDNVLSGLAGNDTLNGNAGNDTLIGGSGNDTLIGGSGDDVYVIDGSHDAVIEYASQGTDWVQSSVTCTLAANVENLTLTGDGAIDGTGNALDNVITGNDGNNTLFYTGGRDTLDGGAGSDTADFSAFGSAVWIDLAFGGTEGWAINRATLAGGTWRPIANLDGIENLAGSAFDDVLIGDAGDDTLIGGTGNDTMTGSAGADRFVFNTALSASTNVDTVTDFVSGTDKLLLDHAIFSALAIGAVADANLVGESGVVAHDANDFLLYDAATGSLFYDPDGSGAQSALLFAALSNCPAIVAGDLNVV